MKREKEEYKMLCGQYSLNMDNLDGYFILSSKGYNNNCIAKTLRVSRMTIQRLVRELQLMNPKLHFKLLTLAVNLSKVNNDIGFNINLNIKE